ncbi:MAG: IS66 family transposase [Burkholderiales bacterium]
MAGVVGDNLSREELLALVRQLSVQNDELKRRVAQLERELAAARKNSSNSSKPPSSDITQPGRDRSAGSGDAGRVSRRKIGGQPGHVKHERAPFPPGQVHRFRTHRLRRCPDCGGRLRHLKEQARVMQQVEIVVTPVRVTEHRAEGYACRHCGRTHHAPLPPTVEAGGLLGPRLTAIVAYLKGACHASFSTIRKFFRDVLKLPLSRGYLVKLLRKATRAMEPAYAALRQRLPNESRLNVDETGHRENGKRPWTWCFRADDFAWFQIADSRGSDVLWETLGAEFAGVLGCDYFSAYRKFMKGCDIRVQFCLAHLIRDLRYMETLPDRATMVYAGSLVMALRDVFRVIHRRERLTPAGFTRALRDRRDVIVEMATHRAPRTPEAQNMAARFRRHGHAYFEFITTPGVSPTNNLAEQAIRFVVIDRHITQGTRGAAGRRWCERIWTTLATCAQQGRSAFEFLHAALVAEFTRKPAPLLYNTS